MSEITTDCPDDSEDPIDKPFDVDSAEDLVTAGLSGPSSVLLVDQAGNVLGDLSLTLDSNQMPVFITHVAKAVDTDEESSSAVIELSEVSQSTKLKQDDDFNLKTWLSSFQEKVSSRLNVLEEKASALDSHCEQLKQKTQNLAAQINKLSMVNSAFATGNGRSGTIIVGVPPSGSGDGIFPIITNVFGANSALQLITHNTKDDYPDGSWLGDVNNPEARVRCPIHQRDLDHLTKACPTGEKMALTLLDYLFDRETQACSNISGNSKHGKKQLDPLKIYGIKCHVMHHFGVDDAMWQKIKLNLDSKCRTAFRRKLKGMPLTVKAFRDSRSGLPSLLTTGESMEGRSDRDEEDEDEEEEEGRLSQLASLEEEEEMPPPKAARLIPSQRSYHKYQPRLLPKTCLEEEDETAAVLSLMEVEGEDHLDDDSITIPLSQLYGEPQVLFASQTPQLIQTESGDFQLVQATPEQLAQIQQGHPIEILTTMSPDCTDPC